MPRTIQEATADAVARVSALTAEHAAASDAVQAARAHHFEQPPNANADSRGTLDDAKQLERTIAADLTRAQAIAEELEQLAEAERQLETRRRARAHITGAELEEAEPRDVVSVGWDARSEPMLRYRDELERNDSARSHVTAADRARYEAERPAGPIIPAAAVDAKRAELDGDDTAGTPDHNRRAELDDDEAEPFRDRGADDKRAPISEAELERIADRSVQRRLERSNRYRNAANAEEQAEAEAAIEAETLRDLAARYKVTP